MRLVSEVMNRFPLAVEPECTVGEARERARAAGASHVLVVEQDVVIGMLCRACDLAHAEGGERVCERMTVPVVMVRPDATLEEAAELMSGYDVHCLPVALGGLLLGTVDGEVLGYRATAHGAGAAGVGQVAQH